MAMRAPPFFSTHLSIHRLSGDRTLLELLIKQTIGAVNRLISPFEFEESAVIRGFERLFGGYRKMSDARSVGPG